MSTPVTAPAAEAAVPPRPRARGKRKLTERQRGERKLAYMLCAPAVLAMVAVTAYPIAYALWLSLQRSDLRFPDQSEFVGLELHHRAHRRRLVVGVDDGDHHRGLRRDRARARDDPRARHAPRDLRRGFVRASILVPYGIITVVAALAWQFMFTPSTGFIPWRRTRRC